MWFVVKYRRPQPQPSPVLSAPTLRLSASSNPDRVVRWTALDQFISKNKKESEVKRLFLKTLVIGGASSGSEGEEGGAGGARADVDDFTVGLVKAGLNFKDSAVLALRNDLMLLVDPDSGKLHLVSACVLNALMLRLLLCPLLDH